jgi:CBS domain-containing protein
MAEHLMVADIMTKNPVTVFPESKLSEVYEIMTEHLIRHIPVINHSGELEGVISHRDLVRTVLFAFEDLPFSEQKLALERISAREVMTTEPESIGPEQSSDEAAMILLDNKFGCVPVISGTQLVGIVTEADFVALSLKQGR